MIFHVATTIAFYTIVVVFYVYEMLRIIIVSVTDAVCICLTFGEVV